MGDDAPVYAGTLAFGIELGRLERALPLQAFELGDSRFEITGGEEPHFVDLAPSDWSCDCADFAWRGGVTEPCKHILRARLARGDAVVILAVAALLAATREYASALERRLRPKPVRVTRALRARVARVTGRPASALSFTEPHTGPAGRMEILIRGTGELAGVLVRDDDGIVFTPAGRPEPIAA